MSVASLVPLTLPLLAAAAAVIVLVADLFLPLGRGRILGWLTATLLGMMLIVSFTLDTSGTFGEVYVGTAWSLCLGRLFLVAAFIAVLGSIEYVAQKLPRRQGEYYELLLFSLVGMLLLPGARDVLLIVVAFELMGIPLYLLAGYAKGDAPKLESGRSPAAEAAIKLYLVGATSTAITLFGVALVVGMAGSTHLSVILSGDTLQPITKVGMMLVLGGMSFKLGLVPFHMWVPDTYQGAPTPFVAFLSVAPKVAGIAAIVAMFILAPAGHEPGPWASALRVLAAAAMIVGNILALAQTDVRRLLGYSGVAQMGYVLLGVATGQSEGLTMAAFYLAAYVFTNMGAFFVLHAALGDGGRYDLAGIAGLSRRSPWLGVSLLVFLLSLAGIPFAIGFWAKLYVFLAAFRAGFVGLVALGAVLAVVGLFYYMQVARAAFMAEPETPSPALPPVGVGLRVAVLACLLGVVGFGAWPGALFDQVEGTGQAVLAGTSVPDSQEVFQ